MKKRRGEESKGKLHPSGMSAAVNSPTPHHETNCVRAQVGPIPCYQSTAYKQGLNENFSLLFLVFVGVRPSQTFAGGLAIV